MMRGRVAYAGAIHEAYPDANGVRLADGRVRREDEVVWLAPIEVGTIFALGLNYAEHAKELQFNKQEEPLVFLKGPGTVIGHRGVTRRPADVTFMHYECELAVVIGQTAKNVKRDNAMQHVAGYMIANDYAIRDYMENYDRVGDRLGDERLKERLEHAAEQALYPWQFCFILGGGWRRASALASSARAAGADLVLAAAAVRQLGTRDARCSREMLMKLVGDVMPIEDIDAAITWLISQRLLLNVGDLRCPHQRLASVLFKRILEGQSAKEHQIVARMLETVFCDEQTPLAGLSLLLSELSFAGDYGRWRWLVKSEWLAPVLMRCWAAATPTDIRDACWLLCNVHGYLPQEMDEFARHKNLLADWIQGAPEGAGYAIARVINHIHNTNEALGKSIVSLVDPAPLAQAIGTAGPLHAGEIARLISTMGAGNDDAWKARYLEHIDRSACWHTVSNWPQDA